MFYVIALIADEKVETGPSSKLSDIAGYRVYDVVNCKCVDLRKVDMEKAVRAGKMVLVNAKYSTEEAQIVGTQGILGNYTKLAHDKTTVIDNGNVYTVIGKTPQGAFIAVDYKGAISELNGFMAIGVGQARLFANAESVTKKSGSYIRAKSGSFPVLGENLEIRKANK